MKSGAGQVERDRWSRRERLFGSAVALSEDGTIVAVGALTGSSGARLRESLSSNGAIWDQVGQTLEGRQLGDNLGNRFRYRLMVKRFAIQTYQADAASGAGYVQVYQLAGTTWTQVGADIVGLRMARLFGAEFRDYRSQLQR
jgi:hypothetical protein